MTSGSQHKIRQTVTHIHTQKARQMTIDAKVKEDIEFLLSFTPTDDPDAIPAGLAPMFYITNTYKGDVELAKRVHQIRDYYDIPVGDPEDEDFEEA